MPGNYTITTRASGTVLTAAIYNADHQNHVDNATPQGVGGYSANQAQMQTQTDPGAVGSESLAGSVAGELERIRFVLARLGASTFWYTATGGGAATLASAATVDVSTVSARCIDISGVANISSFGTSPTGTIKQCRITGAGLSLVQSGTVICPGSVNLALTTFDQFSIESYGGGTWAVIDVLRAGGDPVMGWATKATQQTGTDAVRSVTASQQHQHSSAVKAFGLVASAGSVVVAGYPASASSVKNAVGNYTVTHGQTMSSSNYVVVPAAEGVADCVVDVFSRTNTQFQILIYTGSTGAAVDANVNYAVFGQLA